MGMYLLIMAYTYSIFAPRIPHYYFNELQTERVNEWKNLKRLMPNCVWRTKKLLLSSYLANYIEDMENLAPAKGEKIWLPYAVVFS